MSSADDQTVGERVPECQPVTGDGTSVRVVVSVSQAVGEITAGPGGWNWVLR